MHALPSSHDGADIERSTGPIGPKCVAMKSPKSGHDVRLAALLSKLPKLVMPTPYEPLETFALFPNLPLEIRLSIWKLLSTQPRKVKLFFGVTAETCDMPRMIDGQSKHPAVLGVNRESRFEGLRFYTLYQEVIRDRPLDAWVNCIYVNFDSDSFSLDWAHPTGIEGSLSFHKPVLKKIKYVDLFFHKAEREGRLSISDLPMQVAGVLMRTNSLVEIRAVMPLNDRGDGSGEDAFSTSLMRHNHARNALDEVANMARTIIKTCREILIARSLGAEIIPSIHAKFSAVFSPGMDHHHIWDYRLEDLNNSSRVETLLDI